MPRHVRKGDTVIVTAGDARGQTGVITRVIPKADRVIVQGLNLRTRHMKPSRLNPQGGVVTRESPIHISNISPLAEGRATRVRFVTKADGAKVRVAARGGKELGPVHGPRDGRAAKGAPAPAPPKKKTVRKAASKAPAAKAAGGASKKKSTRKKTAKKSES